MPSETILLTGATGYIGGRLAPCLVEAGYRVRCLVRDPDRLRGRAWEEQVEMVQGDALQYETLVPALQGIDTAYYLIHSLGAGEEAFAQRDRQAAEHFGRAAREAGVRRIIYLGGIKPKAERLSQHLKSRLETRDCLRRGGVPLTAFRAGVIVGSGSLSFELIRYLTERVPVLITPKWVRTPTQPIAIRNVLQYLTQVLEIPESKGRIIEIGGDEVLTYGDMFRIYTRVRAEMKVPGRAWLQFEVAPLSPTQTRLTQTAFFEPKGLLGFFYWYLFYIPHCFIFPGMLRKLGRRAEKAKPLEKQTWASNAVPTTV